MLQKLTNNIPEEYATCKMHVVETGEAWQKLLLSDVLDVRRNAHAESPHCHATDEAPDVQAIHIRTEKYKTCYCVIVGNESVL